MESFSVSRSSVALSEETACQWTENGICNGPIPHLSPDGLEANAMPIISLHDIQVHYLDEGIALHWYGSMA